MDEFVLSDNEEDMLYKGICPYCETETVGDKNADHLLFKYKNYAYTHHAISARNTSACILNFPTQHFTQNNPNKTHQKRKEKKMPRGIRIKNYPLKKALTQKTKTRKNSQKIIRKIQSWAHTSRSKSIRKSQKPRAKNQEPN